MMDLKNVKSIEIPEGTLAKITFADGKLVWQKHVHSYSSYLIASPTCTASGKRRYTCSCGASYTATIPATGHSYTVTTPATCTTSGIKTCSCGATQTIPATGHNYVKCQCTRCGEPDPNCCSNMITVIIPPTCTDMGGKEQRCSVCGTVANGWAEGAPLGHNFVNGVCTRCGSKMN